LGSEQQSVFGLHAVTELLQRRGKSVECLLLQSGRRDRRLNDIRNAADSLGLTIREVSREELDDLVPGRHQGVVAQLSPEQGPAGLRWSESQLLSCLSSADRPPLLLVLDGVTDPHNLGACLRSADAAGVTAVIVPKDRSASLSPTAIKVASGAAETVPLVQVTNLARTLDHIKSAGVWLYGAAGEASASLYEQDLAGPVALVLGSEGKGLRRLTREHCDVLVSLPMQGAVSSLNVSVAAGICLFEAVRQRRSAALAAVSPSG
jgi:23S rRNA (guanosine2251-2'-O)-methyltransferase